VKIFICVRLLGQCWELWH
jgi:hypothetical protein